MCGRTQLRPPKGFLFGNWVQTPTARAEPEAKTIDVVFVDCNPTLEMPNVFTPNGDDKNAAFKPISYNNIACGEITILNRWGETVITTDLLAGWSGNVGSMEASSGVYYYHLSYYDYRGFKYIMKGVVELIR